MIRHLNALNSSFSVFIFFFLSLAFLYPNLLSIFKSQIPLFLGFIMFCMGMTLDLSDFKNTLKKPHWYLTAIILQFTVMPITSLILVKLFEIRPELALGIIILGCCPGGTASNLITYLCKGNLALSIISTFFSTLISVFLTPILIYLISNQSIEIDILSLVKSLFLIVFFPVTFGLVLKIFIFKNRGHEILPKVSEIFIAFIIGIIFSLNIENIKNLSILLFLCVFLHNTIGLISGYLVGSFFGFSDREKKTIAIEVGMQNSGLGMALSLIHFSKLVAVPSAIFSLWHNISAVGLVYLWKKK